MKLVRPTKDVNMRTHRTSKPCQLSTLANGPFARVERCEDCGTISVHLGAVSMRLDRAAAESLWTTLGEGLGSLRLAPDDESARFAS